MYLRQWQFSANKSLKTTRMLTNGTVAYYAQKLSKRKNNQATFELTNFNLKTGKKKYLKKETDYDVIVNMAYGKYAYYSSYNDYDYEIGASFGIDMKSGKSKYLGTNLYDYSPCFSESYFIGAQIDSYANNTLVLWQMKGLKIKKVKTLTDHYYCDESAFYGKDIYYLAYEDVDVQTKTIDLLLMHETIDGDKEELTRFKAIRDDALPSITFKKNEALCTIDNVTYQITYANGQVTKLS